MGGRVLMNACMIYVATSGPGEAKSIAKALVSERLIACANIIDGATSIYRWDDQVKEDTETLLIAKTSIAQREEAMHRMRELHSYETPCVVAYDIAAGLPDYLDWITSECRS